MSDKPRLMRYVEAFLEIDRSDRDGLAFVEYFAKALKEQPEYIKNGTFDNMMRVDAFKDRPGFEFITEALKDRKAIIEIETALVIVKKAKELRHDLIHDDASNFVQHTLAKFGIDARYNKPIDATGKLGGKFIVEADGTLTASDIPQKPIIFFDGIDQNPARTTTAIMENLRGMGIDPCALCYSGTLSSMGKNFGEILSRRDSHSGSHEIVARNLLESDLGSAERTLVGYSNGVFFIKGVMNAVTRKLFEQDGLTADEVTDTMQRFQVFSVGVQPLWRSGFEVYEGKKLFEHQVCPEISVCSPADMFGPSSEYHAAIVRGMMVRDDSLGLDKNVVVMTDPQNLNKIGIFIHPSILNISYETPGARATVNIGGHRFQNYMATLGLIEGVPAASDECATAGAIIKKFLNRELDTRKTPLAPTFRGEGFEVAPLIKPKFRDAYPELGSESANLAWEAAFAKQIAAEYLALGCKHPLLDSGKKIALAR